MAELWGSAFYRQRVEMVEKLRPLIPRFDYRTNSNIEEIKYRLAQQEMFEAVMALIKPTEG